MLLSPIFNVFPSQPLIFSQVKHSFFPPPPVISVLNIVSEYLTAAVLWLLTHHQFLLHSWLFGAVARVCVLGWRCRLLFLLYHLLFLFCHPVLRPLVLGLLKLVLSLVVGVVLGVQLTIYGTLQKRPQ